MLVHCKTYNAPRPTWYRVSGHDGEGLNVLAFTRAEARERFLNLKGWTRMRRGFTIARLHAPSKPRVIEVVQKTTRTRAVRKARVTVAPVTLTTTTPAPLAQDVLNTMAWIEPHAVNL